MMDVSEACSQFHRASFNPKLAGIDSMRLSLVTWHWPHQLCVLDLGMHRSTLAPESLICSRSGGDWFGRILNWLRLPEPTPVWWHPAALELPFRPPMGASNLIRLYQYFTSPPATVSILAASRWHPRTGIVCSGKNQWVNHSETHL